MPEEKEFKTIVDGLQEGIIDSEGTTVEGDDYKERSKKIYKNSIAHYDVLIANLTSQAANPTINESLKADYENQLKDAKARRDEVQMSLDILEKEEN